jgi:hypothetical protein
MASSHSMLAAAFFRVTVDPIKRFGIEGRTTGQEFCSCVEGPALYFGK